MQRVDACRLPFFAENPNLFEQVIEANLIVGRRCTHAGATTVGGVCQRAKHWMIWALQRAVVVQAAVLQFDAAIGLTRDVRVVRDHQNRVTRAMQLAEQFHHDGFVFLVEVAGRLVGQNQLGLIDQGASNRHALLFATRKLRGKMRQPVAEPDALAALRPLAIRR